MSYSSLSEWWHQSRGSRTQEDIASVIGADQTTVSAFERGTRIPAPRHMGAMMEQLRLPESEQLQGWRLLFIADANRKKRGAA